MGFSINGLDKEQLKLLEGKGKFMRHIKVYELESFDHEKVIALLKMCTIPCEDPHKSSSLEN